MNLRRNTDGLKNSGSADHVSGGGQTEVVCAWLDGLRSGTGNSRHQLSDVGSLSCSYGLESSDLIGAETESRKLRVRELCKALLVKG